MNWKAISGYEGYYEVSDSGIVRSIDRIVSDKLHGSRRVRGRIMKQAINRQGYCVVNLHKCGISSVCHVHKLVAEAFIPNNSNLPTVNHKDGCKSNNAVGNLEWATYAENNVHAVRCNLRIPHRNPVLQISASGDVVAAYISEIEASRQTGINYAMISHALHGRTNTAGGFRWKRLRSVTTIPQGSTAEDESLLEVQGRRKPKI